MTIETLSFINELLSEFNYSFQRWNGEIIFPYWVSEYSEVSSVYEDNSFETDFIITGTTENSWAELVEEQERIISLLDKRIRILSSGNGLEIHYDRSLIVPTNTDTIKRVEIHFSIKEWRTS